MNVRRKVFRTPGNVAISVLLVLALFMAAVPQPARAAPTATCAKMYTVVAGDTLSKIALTYNTTVEAIAAANNIPAPYNIVIGQVLCIPGTATSSGSTSTSTKPDFTVKREANRITIEAKNMVSKATFFIKIGPDTRQNTVWTRLGNMRVNKTGAATKSFQLPKQFRNVPYVICLKNVRTDAVFCKKVIQ